MSKFGTCVKINMGKGMKFGAAVKACNKSLGSGNSSSSSSDTSKGGVKKFPTKK